MDMSVAAAEPPKGIRSTWRVRERRKGARSFNVCTAHSLARPFALLPTLPTRHALECARGVSSLKVRMRPANSEYPNILFR
jgi:hypothetical protein